MATRNAKATWTGTLKEGDGTMGLGSGTWEGPFTFKSRFEPEEAGGTNPEELIAAAEAGCFTMALNAALERAGHLPERVESQARVTIRQVDGNPTITQIDLVTNAKVPGLDEDTFQQTVQETKENCIVSRALGAIETINVDATLEG